MLRRAAVLLLALGAGACTDGSLLSPDGARPHANLAPLLSITPDSAVVGDTGVVLTLRGSGFTQFTAINIDPWLPFTQTLVDDSTIAVRIEGELQQAQTHQVVVFDEWWMPSDPLPFVVANPAPVITRMTPDWCDVGGDCGTVTLVGRHFMPGVEVLWNGNPRNITRQSDSVIVMELGPYATHWAEIVEVTAVNPAPGGGSSAPVIFQIGTRVVMHTSGATAGSSGFELEIYGESFNYGAVVYWNGAPKETTVHNSRRISVWISAADVAVPGEAVVTLSTWNLLGGQPFRVGTVTVRPQPAATVTSQLTLPMPVRDLVYSPVTGRLYATVYDGPDAGTVAVIDPATGTVENSIWVGDSPRYLALADDGMALWVGVDGEHRVKRIQLPYGYSDMQVQLDSGIVAEDLAAVPGKPYRVAIARKNTCCSPRHAGVALYSWSYGAQVHPDATPSGIGSNVIEFGLKGSTLYGMDNETTENRFRTMAVDDGGATLASNGWSVGVPFYVDMVFAAGRLYTSKGPIIDTGYDDWAGFFQNMQGAVRPDVATGRAFFLDDNAIRVGDINTFALLGTLPVPPLQFEHPATQRRHLVRWGADGLAWHDADQVFLLRSPIVGP